MSDNEIHDDDLESLYTIDTSTAELPKPRGLIPNGVYDAVVTEIGVKQNQKKPGEVQAGTRLALTVDIAGGPYENRKLWPSHTLTNKSPKATEIGHGQIRQLRAAAGLAQNEDLRNVCNRPIKVRVGVGKVTDEYPEPKNEVKEYLRPDGSNVTADGASPVSSTAKTVQKPKGPAWANKKKDAEGEAA